MKRVIVKEVASIKAKLATRVGWSTKESSPFPQRPSLLAGCLIPSLDGPFMRLRPKMYE